VIVQPIRMHAVHMCYIICLAKTTATVVDVEAIMCFGASGFSV